ncbi:hypothetical protein M0802_012737 [Mischocyttarus mexicanus]|nr:hypothetical protein M0802_012737 [Mischocyttarus mexicanus]
MFLICAKNRQFSTLGIKDLLREEISHLKQDFNNSLEEKVVYLLRIDLKKFLSEIEKRVWRFSSTNWCPPVIDVESSSGSYAKSGSVTVAANAWFQGISSVSVEVCEEISRIALSHCRAPETLCCDSDLVQGTASSVEEI